jgi:uncharacterized membrane protein
MPSSEKLFSAHQRIEIENTIKEAENKTSGEIKLFIEDKCPVEVLDRAAFIFNKLKIGNTERHNGVLFYLSVSDHQVAIIGDKGIHAHLHQQFWDLLRDKLLEHFRNNRFTEGLTEAITEAGNAMAKHFPPKAGDINELPDTIVFGDKES